MFLFKNTKSIVKRIGMNMAVYGFAGAFVFMMLAVFLPKIVANYIYVFMVASSVAAITGVMVSMVCFFVESILLTKQYKQLDEKLKKQFCLRCGNTYFITETFNTEPYCYSCSSYYSSKFKTVDGNFVDKKTGAAFMKEVVLLARPLDSCRGGIEPTDFVINIFSDKVEIIWGFGWRGGSSHADGVNGIEVLEANYFEKNTIDDFVKLLNEKHWGKDFVKWFDVKNNEKIIKLFFESNNPKHLCSISSDNDGVEKMIGYKLKKKFEKGYDSYSIHLDRKDGKMYFVHSTLEHVGATCDTEIQYVKPVSFENVKSLLLYEVNDYKELVERWEQNNDTDRANSCKKHVQKLEIIINTNENNWIELTKL